jgi:hypothetical protein
MSPEKVESRNPLRVCTSRPDVTSQTLMDRFSADVAIRRLSGLKATNGEVVGLLWLPPDRLRKSRPVAVSHNLTMLLRADVVASSRPSGLKIRRVTPKLFSAV